jgi:hypothetical protein
MAWRIDGTDIVNSWAQQSDNFDAMFAVMMWLLRIEARGPEASDDVTSAMTRTHVEGSVMITYLLPPGPDQVVVLSGIVDLT